MKAIKRIVGNEYASDSEQNLLAYSYDGSQLEQKPELVCWPKSIDEIRKIILHCNQTHTPLIPRGAGTNLAGSAIGEKAVIMDMTRMNKILKLDIKNKTVTVEPGVVLANLNTFLKEHSLTFPIIPSSQQVCTIGGMIATNASSSRSLALGRMDNWIVDLELFDGTGKFYDSKPLKVAGTEGTTAIVTKATLKVTDPIIDTTLELQEFSNPTELFAVADDLKNENGILSVEFFDKAISAMLGLPEKYHLLAEYSTREGKIKTFARVKALLDMRTAIDALFSSKGYIYREDPWVPSNKLYDLVEWCENNKVPCFGHVAMGVLHTMFLPDQKELRKELYELITTLGGRHSGQYGYGLLKKGYAPAELKTKIIKLKDVYDYNNILNRGKIFDYR